MEYYELLASVLRFARSRRKSVRTSKKARKIVSHDTNSATRLSKINKHIRCEENQINSAVSDTKTARSCSLWIAPPTIAFFVLEQQKIVLFISIYSKIWSHWARYASNVGSRSRTHSNLIAHTHIILLVRYQGLNLIHYICKTSWAPKEWLDLIDNIPHDALKRMLAKQYVLSHSNYYHNAFINIYNIIRDNKGKQGLIFLLPKLEKVSKRKCGLES